jgi:hypothetical protein
VADPLRRLNDVQATANGGKLLEAEAACRAIIADAPTMPEATAVLGFILGRLNRFDEARMHLEAAIGARGDVPDWHLELAQSYRRAPRLDDALTRARIARYDWRRTTRAFTSGSPGSMSIAVRTASPVRPCSTR